MNPSPSPRYPRWMKSMATVVAVVFSLTTVHPPGYGQGLSDVVASLPPSTGTILTSGKPFVPVSLLGIEAVENNPLMMNFIVGSGQTEVDEETLQGETLRLVRYFLAALTTPEEDMWVNLSPEEPDRIIPESFGRTELGRDLLAEDYLLKQMTSSMLYPDSETGRRFWAKVYEESARRYGTIDVPVESFNRVWIVPDEAQVYEDGKRAFITKARMKVMLERDYLGEKMRDTVRNAEEEALADLGRGVMREVIIPELEREVNEGKHFAHLRQMYDALVLAAWYRKNLKESFLNQRYTGRNKIAGVEIEDGMDKEKIYERYVEAFKQGLYELIRDEEDPLTMEMIPRRYFAGGVRFKVELNDRGSPVVVMDRSDRHETVKKVEVTFDPTTHDAINTSIKNKLEDIANALGLKPDDNGQYDFKTLAETREATAENPIVVERDGEVIDYIWIQDGALVIAADFGKEVGAHYGFKRNQVYVNMRGLTKDQVKAKAAHEIKEAGLLEEAFNNIKTLNAIEVKEDQSLRQAIVAWATDSEVEEEARRIRQETVMEEVIKAHIEGLKAERDALPEGQKDRIDLQNKIKGFESLLAKGSLLSNAIPEGRFDIVIQSPEWFGLSAGEGVYKAARQEYEYESLLETLNNKLNDKLKSGIPSIHDKDLEKRLNILNEFFRPGFLKGKPLDDDYDRLLRNDIESAFRYDNVYKAIVYFENLKSHIEERQRSRWSMLLFPIAGAFIGIFLVLLGSLNKEEAFPIQLPGVISQKPFEQMSDAAIMRWVNEQPSIREIILPSLVNRGWLTEEKIRVLFLLIKEIEPRLLYRVGQEDGAFRQLQEILMEFWRNGILDKDTIVGYLMMAFEDMDLNEANRIADVVSKQLNPENFPTTYTKEWEIFVKAIQEYYRKRDEYPEINVPQGKTGVDGDVYNFTTNTLLMDLLASVLHGEDVKLYNLKMFLNQSNEENLPTINIPSPISPKTSEEEQMVSALAAFFEQRTGATITGENLSEQIIAYLQEEVDKTRTEVKILTGEDGLLFDPNNDYVVGLIDEAFQRPRLVMIGSEEKPIILAVGSDRTSVYIMQRFVARLMDETRRHKFKQEGLIVPHPSMSLVTEEFDLEETTRWIVSLYGGLKEYENDPANKDYYERMLNRFLQELNVQGPVVNELLRRLENTYSRASEDRITEELQNEAKNFFTETMGYKDGQLIRRPWTLMDVPVDKRSGIVWGFFMSWEKWMQQDIQHASFSLREILGVYEEALLYAVYLELYAGNEMKARLLINTLMREELYKNLLEEQNKIPNNKSLLDLMRKLTKGGIDPFDILGMFLSIGVAAGRPSRNWPSGINEATRTGESQIRGNASGPSARFVEPMAPDAVLGPDGEKIGGENKTNDPLGGIQFNPNAVRLIERGTGTVVTLPDIDALKDIDFDGLVPVILNMQPVSIPALLGLQDDETVDEQKAKGSEAAPQPSSARVGDGHAAWLDPREFYLKRRGSNAPVGV